MTEDEARAEAARIAGPAMSLLERYAEMLLAENARQNLVARSTEASIWTRHLLDSLQLARFARGGDSTWIDVGSGPGLPGIVLAALDRWKVILVEPRRRRVEFLTNVLDRLQLRGATVRGCDIRQVRDRADVISARAVASVDALLELTSGCADPSTRFILPKGRSALDDVDLAKVRWQGLFHVEQSITDPAAGIVIADRVRRR